MLTLLVISVVLNLIFGIWLSLVRSELKECVQGYLRMESRLKNVTEASCSWEGAYFRAKDRHMNDSEEWFKIKTHLINKIKELHKELKR